VGKTANSLLKDGAKIHLKNERKIIRPKGLKSTPNPPQIDRESTKDPPKVGPKPVTERAPNAVG
jgi:hypothetical protein